jgi:hypothetical protein
MVWGEGGAMRVFNSCLFTYTTVRISKVHENIIPIDFHGSDVLSFLRSK